MVLVAVAVDEKGKTATFAGRVLDWKVYWVSENEEITFAWDIHLSEFGSMHEWHVKLSENHQHPLHHVDIAIAASAGEGVINNLKTRNTQLLTTDASDPMEAVRMYLLQREHMHVDEEDQICLDPEKRALRSKIS